MKTHLFVLAAMFLINGYAFATGPGNMPVTNDNGNVKQYIPISDHVAMTGGIMVTVKNGFMSLMNNSVTMSNGTMVMKDGTYKLKDGDKMDMNGNLMQ
jgi:hypothetical protein